MAAEYPAAIKDFSANVDISTEVNAAYMNQRDQEIEAIEGALGIYPYGGALGMLMGLPGLFGLWLFSAIGSAVVDVLNALGDGRDMRYLGEGDQELDVHSSLTPYGIFNAENLDYYETLSEKTLWTNSAVFPASLRGISLVCWVWINSSGADYAFMCEDGGSAAANNFWLYYASTNNVTFVVFSGSNAYAVTGPALSTGAWHHIVAKWEPSTRLSVTVDGTKYSNTTSIPATINTNTLNLRLGARAPDLYLDGRMTLALECNCALPDTLIAALFSQTRHRFGV